MKGKIWLQSSPGTGSTFHFTASFGLQNEPDLTTVSTNCLKGRRVILRANNLTEHESIRRTLDSAGLLVESTDSYQQLLDQLKELDGTEKSPEIIIVSSRISEKNNFERMLQFVNSEFSKIPVIFITSAYKLGKILSFIEELGTTPFRVLSRPVFPAALYSAILESLGLAKTHDFARQLTKPPHPLSFRLPEGIRLLLVEDNEMNQELAMELLGQAGIAVTLARNGQEALDILETDKKFDGILMDCQMPLMDGYQATRAIRKIPELHDTPIIAMTANAMVGDREKALAAGMNDHITKPVDVSNMFATLAQWITPRTGSAKTISVPAPSQSGQPIPDLAGVNTRQALANLLNNTELYHRMLVGFYHSYSDFRDKFMASFESDDPTAATRFAHSLKSSAGNIGATSIQILADRLEHICKQGIYTATLDDLINEASILIQGVRQELEKVLPQPAEQRVAVFDYDIAQLVPACMRLRELLQESDSETINFLEENQAIFQQALNDKFEELSKLIRSYDFEAALSFLEKIC